MSDAAVDPTHLDARLTELADKVFKTVRCVISTGDTNNFIVALRGACAAIVVSGELQPIDALTIFDLAYAKLFERK